MSTDTQAPTGGQASPSVEMGGPLDTTGASTGGSIMGPMVLLGAGFLTLAVFLARKRR
jgi:LPXTG-motif cell wall-anchored protein